MLKTKLILQKDYVIIEHNEKMTSSQKKSVLDWIEKNHSQIKLYTFKLVKAVKK